MRRAACGKTNRAAFRFAECLVPLVAAAVALALGPGPAHGGQESVVRVGAEMWLEEYRHLIKGQRIGVLTNPSAVCPACGSEPSVSPLKAFPAWPATPSSLAGRCRV